MHALWLTVSRRGLSDMFTFACKRIRQEDLIRCSFELNRTEYNVMMFLMRQRKPLPAAGIAKGMGLERSTVQKAIKRLLEKEIVRRRQRNLRNGGYVFLYELKGKEEIKNSIKEIVREWYEKVEKEIERI